MTTTPSEGPSLLTLANDHLHVVVDPSRGAEVVSITAVGKAAGEQGSGNALAHYDWSTPARASKGQRYPDTAQDWLSDYRGGWQECFPNSGAESVTEAGPTTPFHGEASTAPWEVLRSSSAEAVLQVGTRLPVTLTRHMRIAPDAPVLLIEERAENVADFDVDVVWSHHPVFPAVPGSRIHLPACSVEVEPANRDDLSGEPGTWPRLPGAAGSEIDISTIAEGEGHRLTYQHGLAEGWVALQPPSGSANPALAMAWDLQTWPSMWIWLLAGTPEFPWYGRARMVGLEPNRAWPFDGLAGAVSRGQQLTLGARRVHESWLTLRLLDEADGMSGMSRDGTLRRQG